MTQAYPIRCRIRAADSGVTRVDVFDDIGEGGWFSEGLTAKNFATQMAGIKGALEVHINSAGGDVFDGIAIGNAIRAHKGPVATVVDGLAASIASVIAQAGQDRVMQPGSMLMIHDAFGMCLGNAAEMAKMAETLGQVSDNLAEIYASRAGGTQQQWRDAMKGEKWYTAEEAVAAGLADRVGGEQAQLPAGLDLAAFSAVPGRIAARLRAMPQAQAPAVVNADGNHAPMTGSHAHSHPAYGSQGGDGTHAHDHSHDGDANHRHSHAGADGDGEPDGAQDRAPRLAYARDGRLLGLETMPFTAKALPVHHTATEDSPWDGPAAVAAMPNDDTVLEYCHAWQSDEAASVPHREGDDDADDRKGNYKFPHHRTKGGPANLPACRNGLGRLPGASIPDGDRAGVEAHLRAHLKDGGGDGAEDHAHLDLSGVTPEQIRAALRGATE
jgi:ATP-dependent protease ClpP protease subunit